MATNKNALIRYRTIDKCLQNRTRRWTLNDLIDACSDALEEFEGKDSYVSKRTVQLDIQFMRSDKLGYNAPIVVYGRKYYTYEDEQYSITQIPISQGDLDVLSESVTMLRQFKDFSLFSELSGVIQKLEDKIHRESAQQQPIIHLERNQHLQGLNWLDTLYHAILQKIVLRISYQSFKAKTASELLIHGYILKEYNNRWFLVGRKHASTQILTLALDRIQDVGLDLKTDYEEDHFNAEAYYQDTYGVTVQNGHPVSVELVVDAQNAPYVLTKPFHPSQQLLEQFENGRIRISLRVHHNFELERLILGFGDSVEVLKPRRLRQRIKKKLERALAGYE